MSTISSVEIAEPEVAVAIDPVELPQVDDELLPPAGDPVEMPNSKEAVDNDPVEPIDPIDPVEPIDPIDPVEPGVLVDPIEVIE